MASKFRSIERKTKNEEEEHKRATIVAAWKLRVSPKGGFEVENEPKNEFV